MPDLPSGTVTFLFTDIEGSTRLVQSLGDDYPSLLDEHCRLIRSAVQGAGGVEVSTEGDGTFCAFPTARGGVVAAVEAQRSLAEAEWPGGAEVRVRMGLHSGEARLSGGDYVGLDVHRAARVASAAHGAQVLVSETTRALAEQDLPGDLSFRDLGEHRLKDLTRPERLFQVIIPGLPYDFPTLRTLNAVPNNLPVQLTSFVGRRAEVDQVVSLLARTRLLTLTGPGGTGKTRLSLQAAAEVADRFPDGVYFVALAPISDPDLVVPTIAQTLGLQQVKGPPIERLREHLSDKESLLVLDNFEQVLPAASRVAEILRAASQVKMLVTSRASLKVSGEQEYPVPPLRVPDPTRATGAEALRSYEASSLFIERALAAKPDFRVTEENATAIAEIAARLDGLPLALELAAARVKLLPPAGILERLEDRLGLLSGGPRDLPTRQQTLRDAIAWSYDLLDTAARRLLERLSVFVGGSALEESETVCGPPDELGADVLEGLGVLIDQSLLRQEDVDGEPRFVMLETIREFARERLGESGEADRIEERHARAFLELAERAEPHLAGKDQLGWLDRLEAEHDNLRAALRRFSETNCGEEAFLLAGSLWRFWQIRGHLHEARERLGAVLELSCEAPRARVKALQAAGSVAYWQGDFEGARPHYQQALDLLRALDDRRGQAEALYDLSFTYGFTGEPEKAREMLREALEIFEEIGDRAGRAKVLWNLGNVAYAAEEYQPARELLEESVSEFRELDDPFGLGWALRMLGRVVLFSEGHEAARPKFEESLRIFAPSGDISAVVLHLNDLAAVAAGEGNVERAARLVGAQEGLRERSGTDLVTTDLNEFPGLVEALESLDEDRARDLRAEGKAMGMKEAVAYALGDD